MADFRQIHTRIWKDDWFSELEPDAKLFFIYLFSNEQAEVAGVYELPVKYMSFEVGLSQDRIIQLLQQFEQDRKVFYRNKWVWVVNLRKYNETRSAKVISRITKDLNSLPDGELKKIYCDYHGIPYRYPIDTVSIPDFKSNQGMDTRFKSESETDTETDTETETKGLEWLDEEGLIGLLSRSFEVASQIQAHDVERWEEACKEMFHAGVTPELLGKVVYEMRNPQNGNRKLTVSGPWSCKNVAIAKAGEMRTLTGANGEKLDQAGPF